MGDLCVVRGMYPIRLRVSTPHRVLSFDMPTPIIPARTSVVPVSAAILSSYDIHGATGGPRAALSPLATQARGKMVPEAAAALGKLNDAALAVGGDFRVTDCFRTIDEQAAIRKRYDTWVAAGKPAPGTKAFNATTMKSDYVALPAKSGHNGGRASDLSTSMMHFPGVAADKQLDKLWEIARPLGWRPIIKAPTEGVTENWHFDYPGELTPILDRHGYETWAMCAVLDIGAGGSVLPRAMERAVQFHLTRSGADLGEIDGMIGQRTERALRQALGVASWAAFIADAAGGFQKLLALPTATKVLYTT